MSPQPVRTPLTSAAIFLVVTVDEGGEAAVRDVLAGLAGLQRTVAFRSPADGLTCVAGIGSDAWDRLFCRPRPAGLHPFQEMLGDRHQARATPGDLLFHLRANRMDLCFELAQLIMDGLRGAVTVQDEVHGFRYFDQRNLLGFADGIENPVGAEADDAVTIGREDPRFAGGSYVIVQKYLHDLTAWNALSTEAQEDAMGRSKLSGLEMDDEVKPSNSHVALTVLTASDGTEPQILRDNMPFGNPGSGEFGTYFIGYSRSPAVTEEMMRRMFVGEPPGNHDRLLDFSTAATGCLFFVPTADFLEEPSVPRRGDGSLGIGGLKGSNP